MVAERVAVDAGALELGIDAARHAPAVGGIFDIGDYDVRTEKSALGIFKQRIASHARRNIADH